MRIFIPGSSHSRIQLLEDVGIVWHSVSSGTEIVAAEVCADWKEGEACVLSLHPEADRDEVAKMLAVYWPSLTIVWPEDVTVITLSV